MDAKVPIEELNNRMQRFVSQMDKDCPGWECVIIVSKNNMYYFTGTRQEGSLIIPANNEPVLWVRRSYDRACEESYFPNIMFMNSFREPSSYHKFNSLKSIHVESETIPIALVERIRKYISFENVQSVDHTIFRVRAKKSAYELNQLRKSGEIHQRVLEEKVLQLFREGMDEVELTGDIYKLLLQEGHHGVTRFSMYDTEMGVGQLGFGIASLYPTSFNGPGGNYGLCPAVPHIGSRKNCLKMGDLIFLDVACGYNGYHTDKTMTYMFRKPIDTKAIDIHKRCVEIQYQIASQLKPGAILSHIYEKTLSSLNDEFLLNFMGYGNRTVKFLGHGIGLTIDEWPVIACGFDEPIEENMVFAVEPKKGIENIGMVGIENTFIVTPSGGECITGNNEGLILVE